MITKTISTNKTGTRKEVVMHEGSKSRTFHIHAGKDGLWTYWGLIIEPEKAPRYGPVPLDQFRFPTI